MLCLLFTGGRGILTDEKNKFIDFINASVVSKTNVSSSLEAKNATKLMTRDTTKLDIVFDYDFKNYFKDK